MKFHKCIICDKRPATQPHSYCANCAAKIKADTVKRRAAPIKYLVHHGNVVAIYRNGDSKLNAEPVNRDPERLPKGKTINLDSYCEGFDRGQIKRLKAYVERYYDPMKGVKVIKVAK